VDIAPTILDLADVDVPSKMQGKSMLKALGKGTESWRKDWLYEYYEYPNPESVKPNRGIRTQTHKLIHYYNTPEEFELYDLVNDPGEKRNLYGDPSVAALQAQLKERLRQMLLEIPARKA